MQDAIRKDSAHEVEEGTDIRPSYLKGRSVEDLPEALRVLHEHQVPNEEQLRQEYVQKGLDQESDTFVLYRIIGNDLYPRHAKGQSRENVRFILENEPELERCEKRWVVNRIVDRDEHIKIINLLEQHSQDYLVIPFDPEEYRSIGWSVDRYPEPGFLAKLTKKGPEQAERAIMAAYREKNNYIMNNNGARNYALRDGKLRAKWVLPWDGNCFLTKDAWQRLRCRVCENAHFRYFAVPMQRVTENSDLLDPEFEPLPVEEPQVVFRKDSNEEFNEDYPYGRRPKVELFWRLGIPGKWDRWKDESWDMPRRDPSSEQGQFLTAGWVARLNSGMKQLESHTKESFKQRGLVRQQAIRQTIQYVDSIVNTENADSLGLKIYRSKGINRLRAAWSSGESVKVPIIEEILKDADKALRRKRLSVVDKTTMPPSGDKHDYWHPAPYWWPNESTPDGLPYVKRDGQRVPGTEMYEPGHEKYDRTRIQWLFDDTLSLAFAAYITKDEKYGRRAAENIRTWFIDPETRMNPNLRYAQVRMGHNRNEGYGRGIIELKDFYYFLDAVRILDSEEYLDDSTLDEFRSWLDVYVKWLTQNSQGLSECSAENNHGTYYDLQVASIYSFLGYHDEFMNTIIRSVDRFPQQVTSTGVQLDEMTRTITAHYCCYNLQGWLSIARLYCASGGSWEAFEKIRDTGLGKAVKWLLAHVGREWPYQQIKEFDWDRVIPIAHFYNKLSGESQGVDLPRDPAVVKAKFWPHDGIPPYWNLDCFPSEQASNELWIVGRERETESIFVGEGHENLDYKTSKDRGSAQYAEEFLKFSRSSGEHLNFCRQMIKTGDATVPSPFTGNRSPVIASMLVRNHAGTGGNFLICRDRDEIFFVLQRNVFALAAVSFVRGTVLSCDDLTSPVKKTIEMLAGRIGDIRGKLRQAAVEPLPFRGILVGDHSRPYHQIYDRLPLFYRILDLGLPVPVAVDALSFFSLEQLVCSSRVKLAPAPEADCVSGIYVSMGNEGRADLRMAGVIQYIPKAAARIAASEDVSAEAKEWAECHSPILWVGLSTMKRDWPERLEFAKRIVSEIQARYANAGILLDGVTMPASDLKIKQIAESVQREQRIVDEICSSAQSDRIFSLVGRRAVDKVFMAKNSDFFVANGMTDSVYPACFWRKPGIAHTSHAAYKETVRQHYHPKSYILRVPQSQELDTKKGQGKSAWKGYNLPANYLKDLTLSGLEWALRLQPYGILELESEERECLLERLESVGINRECRLYKLADESGKSAALPFARGRYDLKVDVRRGEIECIVLFDSSSEGFVSPEVLNGDSATLVIERESSAKMYLVSRSASLAAEGVRVQPIRDAYEFGQH